MVSPAVCSTTVRILQDHRDQLLEQLRAISPELVEKLIITLEALQEQLPERGEYDGLDRPAVIRKYLLKVGRPAQLREIRDAVAKPASRFDGRSIWDGGKREVEHGRMLNVADEHKGEDWVLALPEWRQNGAARPDASDASGSFGQAKQVSEEAISAGDPLRQLAIQSIG